MSALCPAFVILVEGVLSALLHFQAVFGEARVTVCGE